MLLPISLQTLPLHATVREALTLLIQSGGALAVVEDRKIETMGNLRGNFSTTDAQWYLKGCGTPKRVVWYFEDGRVVL